MKYLTLSTLWAAILLFTSYNLQAQTLNNGDFEIIASNLPKDWTRTHHTAGVSLSSSQVYSGQYAIKIEDSWTGPSAGVGLRSAKIHQVAEDSLYEVSAMLYNVSMKAYVYIEFWNTNNQRIANTQASTTTTSQWELVKVKARAPKHTAYATAMVYSSSDNLGIFYADSLVFKAVYQAPSSISEPTAKINIQLYPNPVSANGILRWTGDAPIRQVHVFDVSGHLHFSGTTIHNSIQLPSLAGGSYFVRLETADHRAVTKSLLVK